MIFRLYVMNVTNLSKINKNKTKNSTFVYSGDDISLLNNEEDISEGYSGIFQKSSEVLEELPEVFCQETFPSGISAYLFYPFDFTTMQPVGGTRHRPLR